HTRFSRDWSSDVCSSDLFRLRFLLLMAAFFALAGSPAGAQQTVMVQPYQNSFGKNRIQYKDLDWQYYQSPNFNIYYYQGGAEMRSEERRVGKEGRARGTG